MMKNYLKNRILSADTSTEERYGIAVDIGTTNIKMRKVSLETGDLLSDFSKENSQRGFGADVMERIRYACEKSEERLSGFIRKDIAEGMCRMKAEHPERIAVAGNVVMLSLLCGDSLLGMQEHPFTPKRLEISPKDKVWFTPAAGPFIGGDVVAGVSVLPDKKLPWLFLDLGTNGEMVLSDGRLYLATSVAAGPAFEGVLGSGSTALSALAEAYMQGELDETGLLLNEDIELSQAMIRNLQLAKAAVRTGVEFLTGEYEKRTGIVFVPDKVYLAGGMGVISEEACLTVGMLPESFRGKCEFLGNTALQGATELLLKPEKLEEMRLLAQRIEEYELASWPEFNESYIANINLPHRI